MIWVWNYCKNNEKINRLTFHYSLCTYEATEMNENENVNNANHIYKDRSIKIQFRYRRTGQNLWFTKIMLSVHKPW